MGLDQYAFARYAVLPGQELDPNTNEELAYWRKHNRLQGWMEALYYSKGGDDEFNCVDVCLTIEDLAVLEADIDDMNLPATSGFFFGDDSYDDYDEWHAENDKTFLVAAREALEAGKQVFYGSSW